MAGIAGGCRLSTQSNRRWVVFCRTLKGGLAIIRDIMPNERKTEGFLNYV